MPGNELRMYFPSAFPTRKTISLSKLGVLMSLWMAAWGMLPGQYIFAFFVTPLKAAACPSASCLHPNPLESGWLSGFISQSCPLFQGHADIIRRMENFNLGSLGPNFNLKIFPSDVLVLSYMKQDDSSILIEYL